MLALSYEDTFCSKGLANIRWGRRFTPLGPAPPFFFQRQSYVIPLTSKTPGLWPKCEPRVPKRLWYSRRVKISQLASLSNVPGCLLCSSRGSFYLQRSCKRAIRAVISLTAKETVRKIRPAQLLLFPHAPRLLTGVTILRER